MSKNISLTGFSYELPVDRRENEYFLQFGHNAQKIERLTGIRRRGIALPDQTPMVMGVAAAQKTLTNTGRTIDSFGDLVVTHTSVDGATEEVAHAISQKLGFTGSTHPVRLACNGFTGALHHIREGIIETESSTLLISTERPSYHQDPTSHTAFIFADGAAACLVEPVSSGGIMYSNLVDAQSDRDLFRGDPATEITNLQGDYHQRHIVLFMDGLAVAKLAIVEMTNRIAEAMGSIQLEENSEVYIVPHQANKRILDSVERNIKSKFPQYSFIFLENISEVGNTQSVSIPLLLAQKGDEIPRRSLVICPSAGATKDSQVFQSGCFAYFKE